MRSILQIPLEGASGRANTQAVQFRHDRPGLFIRGDHAIKLAMVIRRLERDLGGAMPPEDASAFEILVELADLIERDVQIDPAAMQEWRRTSTGNAIQRLLHKLFS